jgi:hypothetical protein
MIFFYFVCRNLEEKIGSAFILIYIIESIYFISFLYMLQIAILKYLIISLFRFTEYNFDFYCSVGFSGILFALYYLQCNFRNVSETTTQFFGLIPIKAKYSPLAYLILVQVLNPNSSLLGHLSGIFTGYLLKNLFVYFVFPRKEWIVSFELKFENIFNFFTNKLRYIQIKSIPRIHHDDEIKEIDVAFCDLCCIKFIKKIKERRERAFENSAIGTNRIVSAMSRSDFI